jgi:predicted PurR-regulated permease PerM
MVPANNHTVYRTGCLGRDYCRAIIAVAIYNPFLKLVEKLGGRKKLAVTLIAVVSIAAVLIPVISLSSSMIESATTIGGQIESGEISSGTRLQLI